MQPTPSHDTPAVDLAAQSLWSSLREASADHLTPWEPVWAHDHLSRKAFTNRVYWAGRAEATGTALPTVRSAAAGAGRADATAAAVGPVLPVVRRAAAPPGRRAAPLVTVAEALRPP